MASILYDIATVNTGYTFRPSKNDSLEANIHVLQAKDVTAEGIDITNLAQFYLQPNKIKNLESGTVVLSARGSFRAAAYSQALPTMASSSVYVIQVVDTRVLPRFLALYLNSRTAQSYFAQHSTGSSIKTLLIDTLRRLPIPDVPLDRQALHVALHENLRDQQKNLKRKIALNQTILNQAMIKLTEGAAK